MAILEKIYAVWLSGLGCDGCSLSITGATKPAAEDVLLGTLPVPTIELIHTVLAVETGEAFTNKLKLAEDGKLAPFVLLVEGSIPDEKLAGEGWWCALGTDTAGKPTPVAEWVKRLAPKAAAVIAVGTCATYGGIPAAKNNPTGAMGLLSFLGRDFKSALGLPIVCIPGCAPQGDNITETIAYLLLQVLGVLPMIPLDEQHRPEWLFGRTSHEMCPRAGFYEQGDFGESYGTEKCLVKLGCWGPVTNCNVPQRGWMGGVGGTTNVGGICIGCTMPGFPDKTAPFFAEPPGARITIDMAERTGPQIRELRKITREDLDKEVKG